MKQYLAKINIQVNKDLYFSHWSDGFMKDVSDSFNIINIHFSSKHLSKWTNKTIRGPI